MRAGFVCVSTLSCVSCVYFMRIEFTSLNGFMTVGMDRVHVHWGLVDKLHFISYDTSILIATSHHVKSPHINRSHIKNDGLTPYPDNMPKSPTSTSLIFAAGPSTPSLRLTGSSSPGLPSTSLTHWTRSMRRLTPTPFWLGPFSSQD